MSEHTPGPWEVRFPQRQSYNGAHIVAGEVVICRISPKADCPYDQKQANAKLIADAPRLKTLNADLVAALEAIVGLAQATTGSATNVKTLWRVREKARAALKAAEEQT